MTLRTCAEPLLQGHGPHDDMPLVAARPRRPEDTAADPALPFA